MPHLIIVTGGGRGFGQAIARVWAQQQQAPQQPVVVVLMGRHIEALEQTAREIGSREITVVTLAVDLADVLRLPATLDTLRARLPDPTTVQRAILISNAGSTGDLAHTVDQYNLVDLPAYFNFNVTSMAMISTWFLQAMQGAHERILVNISSLLAVEPFANWGVYAAGKAARDQLYRVVALEGSANGVRTLSYAPGPLDNDMQRTVRTTIGHEEQRTYYDLAFREVRSSIGYLIDLRQVVCRQGKLVDMTASATKLVNMLVANTFVSGSHVDFYDLP